MLSDALNLLKNIIHNLLFYLVIKVCKYNFFYLQ